MERPVERVARWVRIEHRRQKIRSLEPLFAKLLALELLVVADHVGFLANDWNDEQGGLNEFAVRLQFLAVDPEYLLAFLEPAQTQTLAKGCPQP